MLNFPNAKINLGLYVTGKRADGYHNLESLFYPVPLTDVLEVIPRRGSGRANLHLHGKQVEGNVPDNLVHQAVSRFAAKQFDYEIHLLKNIPMGAGLGGGSADAAFTLQLLKGLDCLDTSESLFDCAMQLGSDCGFFTVNSPAVVTGRGEALKPVGLSLNGFYLLLVHSKIHVSTKEAYSNIHLSKPNFNLKALSVDEIETWKNALRNDFETSVFEKHPGLKSTKDVLYGAGAVYASMTGTGSTVYGIFREKEKALKAAAQFTDTNLLKL